jgi:hypothetical protein
MPLPTLTNWWTTYGGCMSADRLGTTVVDEEEWRSILQDKGSHQEWKSAIEEL